MARYNPARDSLDIVVLVSHDSANRGLLLQFLDLSTILDEILE